jgi:hypothetical protein
MRLPGTGAPRPPARAARRTQFGSRVDAVVGARGAGRSAAKSLDASEHGALPWPISSTWLRRGVVCPTDKNMGTRYNAKGFAALSVSVQARISATEKTALDRLISDRAAELAADGITGQDTFAAWLRGAIRREAKAKGYPVQDARAPAPSTSTSTSISAKPKPKPKAKSGVKQREVL